MSAKKKPSPGRVFLWSSSDIRTAPEDPPATHPGRDKTEPAPVFESRRYPRLDLKLPILYRVLGAGHAPVPEPVRPFLLAQSRDLSPIGLCLALEEPLAVGTVLALAVHAVEQREKFEALARVVWCRPPEGGLGHLVGLQFVVVEGDRVREDRHARAEDLIRTFEDPAAE
jgi:hypothetical protein